MVTFPGVSIDDFDDPELEHRFRQQFITSMAVAAGVEEEYVEIVSISSGDTFGTLSLQR